MRRRVRSPRAIATKLQAGRTQNGLIPPEPLLQRLLRRLRFRSRVPHRVARPIHGTQPSPKSANRPRSNLCASRTTGSQPSHEPSKCGTDFRFQSGQGSGYNDDKHKGNEDEAPDPQEDIQVIRGFVLSFFVQALVRCSRIRNNTAIPEQIAVPIHATSGSHPAQIRTGLRGPARGGEPTT